MPRTNVTNAIDQKRTTSSPPRRGHGAGFSGPNGICKCPNCGYTESHQRGIPCNKKRCPKCNTILIRFSTK